MKRLCRFVSTPLAFIIAIISTVSVLAATESRSYGDYDVQMTNLYNLCQSCYDIYAVGENLEMNEQTAESVHLRAYSDCTKLSLAQIDASSLVKSYFHLTEEQYSQPITENLIQEKYTLLYNLLNTTVLDRCELKTLVEFCSKETNIKDYYSDDLWTEFKSALNHAKSITQDETIFDNTVNLAYHNLLYRYNRLCVSNQTQGDFDGDGIMTIIDATRIQLYLAKIQPFTTLNSSQIYLFCQDKDPQTELTIITSTEIQRKLARYTVEFDTGAVDLLSSIVEKSNPNNKSFDCGSFNKNILYTKALSTIDRYPDEQQVDIPESLTEYADKIQQAQSESTFTISIMSDAHLCNNEKTSPDKLATAEKIGLLTNLVNIDAVANLGDMIIGNEPLDESLSDMKTLFDHINMRTKSPVFYLRGNHDDNGWYSYEGPGSFKADEMLNNVQWCQNVFGYSMRDIVTDPDNPYGGYGYYDHENSKIRVFLLNSVDIPYVLNDDGTYRYNSYQCYAFSNEQLNFVANALKFSDKQNPNDWAAMFLMHVPLDTTNDNGHRIGSTDSLIRGHELMLAIISAYKNGSGFNFSGSTNLPTHTQERPEDFYVDIDVDYTKKGCGDVISFVNGHTHTDNASRKTGYESSLSYGYTYLGVLGASSFATMVVDRQKSTVTTFKYGEVRPQSVAQSFNYGAIDGEDELGIDMSSGEWTVEFDQFRPTGTNLYGGIPQTNGDGYFVNRTTNVNPDTLQVNNLEQNAKYCTSNAVVVKPLTKYIIPAEFTGTISSYNAAGNRLSAVSIEDKGNCKVILTGIRSKYLVFSFHKTLYPNYNNFYIKEYCSNIFEE